MSQPLVSTDPKAIFQAAKCFTCIEGRFVWPIRTHLLNQGAIQATPPCITPSAPIITSAQAASNSAISIHWSQPRNTGSLITSYLIQWGTVSGGPYPNFQIRTGRQASLTGLISGTTYFFTVTARSSAGCNSVASAEGSATTTGAPGLLNSLGGYWKYDEFSNQAVAVPRADATGNGFTATETGGMIPSGTGIINLGADMHTGSNGLSVVAGVDTRVQTAPYSVSLWVKLTGAMAQGSAIASTLVSGGTKGFLIYITNTGLLHFYSTDDAAVVTDDVFAGNPNVVLNSFVHLVIVYDGTHKFSYFNSTTNGQLSAVAGISKGQQAFVVGNYVGDTAGVPGIYDEVGYWTRALSGADVTRLFNNGNALPFSQF